MNVGTGAVKSLDMLTEAERGSGQWVPVSYEVADRLRAGEALESAAAAQERSVAELVEELKADERGR